MSFTVVVSYQQAEVVVIVMQEQLEVKDRRNVGSFPDSKSKSEIEGNVKAFTTVKLRLRKTLDYETFRLNEK